MTINCKGQLIDLTKPKVMGILNLTPNSFFDGGKYKNETEIIAQVQKMLSEGATFIDIGAYSSKPNAEFVSVEEEMARIVPIVELLVHQFPQILISIDTLAFSDPAKPFLTKAGKARFDLFNPGGVLKVSGKDTNGEFCLFETKNLWPTNIFMFLR